MDTVQLKLLEKLLLDLNEADKCMVETMRELVGVIKEIAKHVDNLERRVRVLEGWEK